MIFRVTMLCLLTFVFSTVAAAQEVCQLPEPGTTLYHYSVTSYSGATDASSWQTAVIHVLASDGRVAVGHGDWTNLEALDGTVEAYYAFFRCDGDMLMLEFHLEGTIEVDPTREQYIGWQEGINPGATLRDVAWDGVVLESTPTLLSRHSLAPEQGSGVVCTLRAVELSELWARLTGHNPRE